MTLSSDEIEVLEYLKTWNGNFVSMVEICRCAGGRHKFKETPHWAKRLMSRLVDEQLIEVNERGHYRIKPIDPNAPPVVEDYFAPAQNQLIVGDDYFPTLEPLPEQVPPPPPKAKRWVSPQMESILKKAAKKPAKQKQHD